MCAGGFLRRFGLDLGFKSRGFIAEADARGGFLIAGRARRRTADLAQFRLGHAGPFETAPAGATLAQAIRALITGFALQPQPWQRQTSWAKAGTDTGNIKNDSEIKAMPVIRARMACLPPFNEEMNVHVLFSMERG